MFSKALGTISVSLLMAVAASSGGEKEAASSAPPPGAQRVDTATAGTLAGRVSFEGVPPENPKVKLSGCRYVPHVVGVQVGQPIEFSNSDDTMHNVHAVPDTNRKVNIGQHTKDQKDVHTFTTAEVMVPLKCDVHPWMSAWVGVVAHPYYAVTRDGGQFELKNPPPGTYTVEAWHEKAGTQTRQVTIGPEESKDVTFTFKASAN